jgi:hypothetical protein
LVFWLSRWLDHRSSAFFLLPLDCSILSIHSTQICHLLGIYRFPSFIRSGIFSTTVCWILLYTRGKSFLERSGR